MGHTSARWIGILAIGSALAAPAIAQDPVRSEGPTHTAGKRVQIVRTDTRPILDGVLDDATWAQAAAIEDLHQFEPVDHGEPSERTVVYVAYDDDYLYVAARMWDSEPTEIRARQMIQGQAMWFDDSFSILLDPFNNKRTGYNFEVNPNGNRRDSVFETPTEDNEDWEGIWHAEASINDEGWVVEFEIPFKTLNFDPNNSDWGFSVQRSIARRQEDIAWVSFNRDVNPSSTGLITGLSGLQQGRGLDIVPSIVTSQDKDFETGVTNTETDPSLDVFYNFTPSLTGVLTLNTDFSATEVDDRQVNLTRFGLFFPEKRDFFLQDADAFEFGGIGGLGGFHQLSRVLDQNARPFFSRRIGLSQSGQPVDLDYGGKLSGRVGPWTLGALAIRQAEFEDVEATDLFVGRAALNVLEESSVGVIATNGDPRSNLDNSLAGVDFRYLNTRLANGKTLEAQAWYQQTETEGLTGDDAAYGVRFRMPGSTGLRTTIGFKEVQANFNPALGYINRAGIRDYSAELGWIKRYPQTSRLRMLFSIVGWQRVEEIGVGLQSEVIDARVINFSNQAGDNIRVLYTHSKEVLREPFTIWDPDPSSGEQPITIPTGEYTYASPGIRFQTETSRRLSGILTIRGGDFFHGSRDNVDAEVTWYPTRHFRGFVSYSHNDIELPEGDFTLRLARLGLDVIFSNKLSWANLVQYDNDSETVGINSRLHWIPQAGREAFVVLNHNLQDLDRNDSFHSTLADLSIKFSYTFRF